MKIFEISIFLAFFTENLVKPQRVWGCQFPVCNLKWLKIENFAGYIFRILQHFATKLWNITNFVMLFQAVMKFLLRSKFSLLRMQVVNWIRYCVQCFPFKRRIYFMISNLGLHGGRGRLPWFQRFIFIIFIAKGRGKINLWLKAAIDSSSRANQFELGSDPDSVSWLDDCTKALWLIQIKHL